MIVVPTGTANIASVVAGLKRAGADPVVTGRSDDVAKAGQVVLPGVGSFGAAMKTLDSYRLRDLLVSRIADGRPTLAICVGMQLLAASSEESPGMAGLGVLPDQLSRFGRDVRTPQLGWNTVEPEPGARFIVPGWAYFANSYRLTETPAGWTGATSDHGGRLIAGLERDGVLACQFHPELSGSWGTLLMMRWLEATGG